MDLTEAEDIKKKWQEYSEFYKKDLNDPDNHDGEITQLEPDMLTCEVKWDHQDTCLLEKRSVVTGSNV